MEGSNQLKAELTPLKFEIGYLKSALDVKIRYHKEYIQSTVQPVSTYEHAEHVKSGPGSRQADLQAELEKMKAEIEELKANLIEKEIEFQGISEENEG